MSKFNRPLWLAALFALKAFVSFFAITLLYRAYLFYGGWEDPRFFDDIFEKGSVPLLHAHGGNECLPTLNTSLIIESKSIRTSCQQTPQYSTSDVRIGTVTAHFGSPQEHYRKALQTHLLHSLVHDTRLEVMCSPVVDSLWNKPAFILSLLLDEMMKPAEERLEWIFWVDRDTLVLDQCRPTSSFLPPEFYLGRSNAEPGEEESDDETHLLVTNDWNGLNNGVFLVRVGRWAIELFSDIVAFRYYRPNVSLPFTEQSAMEMVMNEPKFQRNVQVVPQEWFNTYPGGTPTEFRDKKDEEGLEFYHARRGDFMLHLAGRPGRDKLINQWVEMLKQRKGPWRPEQVQRNADADIYKFWSKLGHYYT